MGVLSISYVLLGICLLVAVKAEEEIANPDLAGLVTIFWDWRLREWPVFGTKYGFHQYDMYLENYNEQAFTQQKDTAVDLLEEADMIDDEALDETDSVTLAVLKELLSNFIEGYKFRKYSIYNTMLPSYESMLAWMPKETLTDYQNILARYRLMDGQIDDLTTLLKVEAHLDGTTLHPNSLSWVISSAQNLASKLSEPETSFLYMPFVADNLPDDIDSDTGLGMKAEVLKLIQEKINPALQKYIDYVANSYGKVDSVYRRTSPGLYGVSGGADYYKACLKWHLTSDITPEEIHDVGLQEVKRIEEEMTQIIQSQGFEGSLSEYMAYLKQDPDNFYNTSEEILKGYEDIIAENHDRLLYILPKIPDYEVTVVRYPGVSGGSYTEPPLDGSRPGTFNAKVDEPKETLIFGMDALTLHEAEPGHHTQATYAMESGIPMFRKLIEYLRYGAIPFNWLFHTAYVEGWALYGEELGVEMGSYTDSLKWFGKYNSEIYRAVRLVVDTGIHAYGWSIEEAEDYMRNHTTLGEASIKHMINRYISVPGQFITTLVNKTEIQLCRHGNLRDTESIFTSLCTFYPWYQQQQEACAYKIGELKIKQLRKESEERLGAAFDKREFHDVLLRVGPVSLSILEKQVRKWLDKKTGGVSSYHVLYPTTLLIAICLFLSHRTHY